MNCAAMRCLCVRRPSYVACLAGVKAPPGQQCHWHIASCGWRPQAPHAGPDPPPSHLPQAYSHFISFNTLQSGVWSQLWLIRHAGLKAQVYVVCDKTNLVGVLFKKEPKVLLLVKSHSELRYICSSLTKRCTFWQEEKQTNM